MEENTSHPDPFQPISDTRQGFLRLINSAPHLSSRRSSCMLQSPAREWTRRLKPFLIVSFVPILLEFHLFEKVFTQTVWKRVGPETTIVTNIEIEEGPSSNKLREQTHERTIYASTPTSVYFFFNSGGWQLIPAPSPLEDTEWFEVHTNAGVSIICVGTNGFYRFSPNEWRWKFLGAGFSAKRRVIALEVAWSNPQVMYAIAAVDDSTPGDDELMKTTDDGDSWHRVQRIPQRSYHTSLLDVRIDPNNCQNVYVTAEAGGIISLTKSTDSGRSWQWLEPGGTLGDCFGLVFDPHHAQRAYFLGRTTTGTALYKTTDSFNSYSCKASIDRAMQVTLHPFDGSRLYVFALPHRLIESTDGGKHWNEIPVDLPNGLVAHSVAIASDGTIYLGTAGKGIVALEREKKLSLLSKPLEPVHSTEHGHR